MKAEKLLLELEEILVNMGYTVRKERGSFRGGYCLLEGQKIIMLNKNQPADYLVGVITRFIYEDEHDISLDDIYVKPAVRKQLSERIKATRAIPAEQPRKNPLTGNNTPS